MPDELDAGKKIGASSSEDKAEKDAPPDGGRCTLSATQPPVSTFNSADAEPNREHRASDPDSDTHAARQVALNRRLVFATFVIAGATVIYMILSFLQWREVRSGGEDTRRLADAAQKQSNATSQQVNAMQGQLETMREQANSMKAQTKTLNDSLIETRKSVAAAEKQANASLSQAKTSQVSARATEQSAQSAREALRPYVGAFIKLTEPLAADKEVIADLQFVNQGSSPADLLVEYNTSISRTYKTPDNCYEKLIGPARVLPHQIKTHKTFSQALTKAQVDAILGKKAYLYLCGGGSYTGIGGRQPLNFCFVYNARISGFGLCADTPF